MNADIVNVLLIILGSLIPLLTYVFVDQLIKWQADIAADRESDIADRATLWELDWAWWSARLRSANPNTRRLANDMQAYLQASRPVES